MLGVESLRGVLGRGVGDGLVPPLVAAVRPGGVDTGSAHHQHVLDGAVGAQSRDRLVDPLLERHRRTAAVLSVAGDDQFGLGILDAGLERRGREPREHHAVHRAQPGARQHRDDRLGHHRHVDRHPVTGPQAEVGQRVGGAAHLVLEFGVGDRAGVVHRLTDPVDRHAVAVAGLDVAVDAVVRDVELAADEPLGERGIRPVEYVGERGVPGQPVGLLGPECQPVRLGLLVERLGRVGVRGELRGRRIHRLGFHMRLGHGCEGSHPTLHRGWQLTCGAAGGACYATNVAARGSSGIPTAVGVTVRVG